MNLSDNIDCSIPCHFIVDLFGSCPKTKNLIPNIIQYYSFQNIFELFLIILSMTAYPLVFLLCLSCLIYRTTRLGFLVVMVFGDYFVVEIIKNYLKEPRPNYKCNKEYGNPSNHSCVSTSIIVWFILEYFYIDNKHKNQSKYIIFWFCILYPFLLYSRYYLNYHSIKQIVMGILLGIFIALIYFILVMKIFIKSIFVQKFYLFFKMTNNLTDDDPMKDKQEKKRS